MVRGASFEIKWCIVYLDLIQIVNRGLVIYIGWFRSKLVVNNGIIGKDLTPACWL